MNNNSFFKKRIQSFGPALKGIWYLLIQEKNAWIHVTLLAIAILSGRLLKISITEWCLVAIVAGLVLAAEALNSAIERLVDHVSPDFSKTAGIIKDLAAGAVLFTSIAAAVTGLIIFIPKIVEMLN